MFPFGGNGLFLMAAAEVFLLQPLSPCLAAGLCGATGVTLGAMQRSHLEVEQSPPDMGKALGHIREYLRNIKDEMRHL